uniref:Uncharacterized protein n=1 Tax=Anguilla anguilla TaxID=7936 RepID=A0A0E9UCI3_ANGAN
MVLPEPGRALLTAALFWLFPCEGTGEAAMLSHALVSNGAHCTNRQLCVPYKQHCLFFIF